MPVGAFAGRAVVGKAVGRGDIVGFAELGLGVGLLVLPVSPRGLCLFDFGNFVLLDLLVGLLYGRPDTGRCLPPTLAVLVK